MIEAIEWGGNSENEAIILRNQSQISRGVEEYVS